jgi:ketosteroid isomerase-like protein
MSTAPRFPVVLCITALALAGAAGGCSRTDPAAAVSADDVQALVRRVQYLEDVMAIQKLQSAYVHRLFTQRFEDIPDMYSRSADVSVEFSDSGLFRGHDSVTRLYNAFGRTREVPGFFILHMAVNPYIEIAADGQSAKSHWLSPGASNSPSGSSWIWGPYYVDYVKEGGQWRILHSNLVPLFRNPYQYSWGESPHHGTVDVGGMLGLTSDGPSSLYRPFNEVRKEKDIFRAHPDLPAPF